jgi:ATP-dependent Clp protease protease subunit
MKTIEDITAKNINDRIKKREVWINGEICQKMIESVVMLIRALDEEEAEKINPKPISIFINSNGGTVDESMAIADTILKCKCVVNTYCIGRAMSGGMLIFCAGKDRFIYQNSVMLAHTISQSFAQRVKEPEIQSDAKYLARRVKLLAKYLESRTKINQKGWIEIFNGPDKYFFPDEALSFGIATKII